MFKWKLYFFLAAFSLTTNAQGPIDGFFKKPGELDIALSASYGYAPIYFAGTKGIDYKRNQVVTSAFANYGLSKRWNLISSLPLINFKPQDASIYTKFKLLGRTLSQGTISVFPAIGGSFPLWSYSTESGQAIGQRAFTIQPILVAQYRAKSGVFLQVQAHYNYSFEPVPAATNTSLKLGYAAENFYMDAWLEVHTGLGDADYQGTVPYDSFRELTTSYQRLGFVFYYTASSKLGVLINGSYVLNGRNISKTLSIGGGVVLKFKND